MRDIRIDQIETAEDAIKNLMTQKEEIFLYFFGTCFVVTVCLGTEVPETNESWCSDCVAGRFLQLNHGKLRLL